MNLKNKYCVIEKRSVFHKSILEEDTRINNLLNKLMNLLDYNNKIFNKVQAEIELMKNREKKMVNEIKSIDAKTKIIDEFEKKQLNVILSTFNEITNETKEKLDKLIKHKSQVRLCKKLDSLIRKVTIHGAEK